VQQRESLGARGTTPVSMRCARTIRRNTSPASTIILTNPAAYGVVTRAAQHPRSLSSRTHRSANQSSHYGLFVMNDRAEIRQAIDDAAVSRLGAIPARNMGARGEIQ
jgi:hypothetical protein